MSETDNHHGGRLGRASVRAALWGVLLLVGIAVGACSLDDIKSVESLKTEAKQALAAKNFSIGASLAQTLSQKAPADREAHFLLAQAKAQVGDRNAALVALEQAINAGFKDDKQIDKDPLLEPIRGMSAYADLMNSSFPSRAQARNESDTSDKADDSSVSIREIDGKQVLRAGDVVVEVPSLK